MNVQTGVSAPTASTESRISAAPSLSQSIAASGSSGGLPSRTSRGSSGSSRRSATICADHRFPRPTWRNSCLMRPAGTRRNGRCRVGAADQLPECPGSRRRARRGNPPHDPTRVRTHRRIARERDRKRRPAAQHPGVAAATRAGQPRVGEPLEERPQPDLAFGPGQRRTEAEVPATGEGQVLARVVALDVETVRVGEDLRVTVGPGQMDDHQFVPTHAGARHVDVLARDSRTHLHRRLQPQDLLDGVGPQLRAGGERLEMLRRIEQHPNPVAQQVHRGLEPGRQHQTREWPAARRR